MKKLLLLLIILLIAFFASKPVFATGLTGAIFTTDSLCSGVDLNIYNSKDDVYLDGGPHGGNSTGLPDGDYYVQVTQPGGGQLGYSNGAPIHVSGGHFSSCYQLSDILLKTSNDSPGYDTSGNGGNEYKVWVCSDANYTSCKTDNFKVKENPQNNFGSIAGVKWQDDNADGVQDSSEPLLSGWDIQLWNFDHSSLIYTATTDSQGFYEIDNIQPGNYQVCEVMQNAWFPSYPTTSSPNCNTSVAVTANQSTNDINFGNYQNALISGMKFEDMNGNGIKDAGDNGLENWSINITGPNSSVQTTDSSGNYSASVKPGTYAICEDLLSGWLQTYPSSSGHDCGNGTYGYQITVTSGQNALPYDFGNFKKINISGYKWLDLNQNGIDNSELHLAGWTIFIDANNNGVLDSGEQNTVTDVNGNYSFSNLGPGTYRICEVMQYLWVPTYPTTSNPNCQSFTAVSGQNVINANFGNFHGPTRTQGFWSTHTVTTNNNWTNKVTAPDKRVVGAAGVSAWCTGNTGNKLNDLSTNQVNGGFWSNIAKTTTGTNRSGLDKARMSLLQQLLAAILNKSTFGTYDGGTIAAAQAAYCGSNISAITASTSQLDAYNSGGDIVPFPSGFNPGNATPTTSQTQADKVFWNTTK